MLNDIWLALSQGNLSDHDDVIKWKQFPRYWPFVRGIHRSPVNSPHKGQWALMFSLICIWINGWVNNREAGDSRRYRVHYDVTLMVHNQIMQETNCMYMYSCNCLVIVIIVVIVIFVVDGMYIMIIISLLNKKLAGKLICSYCSDCLWYMWYMEDNKCPTTHRPIFRFTQLLTKTRYKYF